MGGGFEGGFWQDGLNLAMAGAIAPIVSNCS